MITVVLVEDLALSRAGFKTMLEASGEIAVIGEAANGREGVRVARKLNPDLILMDVVMPELNGIEAARQIHAAQPHIRVLMLSMHADRQYVYESLRAGACGYVSKETVFEELVTAIRTVMAGGTYLSPPLAPLVMDDYIRRARGQEAASELDRLSSREREVLQLLAEGNSSTAIARTLHISARTVETHRANIMEKIDIHTIAGLTKFALRHGLTSL